MGTMSPVSSAKGTNSSGPTRPRCGWAQRMSASSPCDPPARHLDDRQVVDPELLPEQGAAEIRLEVEELRRALAHRRVEHRRPRPAEGLRAVHGGVGVEEEVLRARVAGGRERHADADRGEDLVPRELERQRGHVVEPVRDDLGVGRHLHVVEEDRELVTTVAREGVALAQAALEAHRHLGEQVVARRVAEPVVHRLEAIEVEEHHREPVVVAPAAPRERALHEIEEERPVRELGEWIVQRVVERALRLLAPARHVHEGSGEADRLARRVPHRPAAGEEPAPAVAGVAHPVLRLEPLRFPVEVRLEGGVHLLPLGRVDAVEPVAGGAGQGDGRIPHVLRPRVGEPEASGAEVPVEDAVAGALGRHRVAIRRGEGLAEEDRRAGDAPGAVAERDERPLVEARLALARGRDPQGLVEGAALHEVAQLPLGDGAVRLREDESGQLPPDRLARGVAEEPLRRAVPGEHLEAGIADEPGERGVLEEPAHESREAGAVRRHRDGRHRGAAAQVGDQVEGALERGPNPGRCAGSRRPRRAAAHEARAPARGRARGAAPGDVGAAGAWSGVLHGVVAGARSGDEEALHEVRAARPGPLELLRRLDSLDDGPDAEAVPDLEELGRDENPSRGPRSPPG